MFFQYTHCSVDLKIVISNFIARSLLYKISMPIIQGCFILFFCQCVINFNLQD